MIVMIKSTPDTTDGALGLALAKQGRADLVLMQDGVYFAHKERLDDFSGAVYVPNDDKRCGVSKIPSSTAGQRKSTTMS